MKIASRYDLSGTVDIIDIEQSSFRRLLGQKEMVALFITAEKLENSHISGDAFIVELTEELVL